MGGLPISCLHTTQTPTLTFHQRLVSYLPSEWKALPHRASLKGPNLLGGVFNKPDLAGCNEESYFGLLLPFTDVFILSGQDFRQVPP